MSEEQKAGTLPLVKPDPPEDTRERPHEDFLKAVHDLGEMAKSLKEERVSATEAADRLERLEKRIKEEAKKNVPLAKDPATTAAVKGWGPDRVWNMATKDAEVQEFQKIGNLGMCRAVYRASRNGDVVFGRDGIRLDRIPASYFYKDNPEWAEASWILQKAAGSWWDTATSTSSSEWVPTGIARMVTDFWFLDGTEILALFEQATIPPGVGTYNVPVETTRGQADIESELTATEEDFINTGIFSTPLTNVVSLIPKKHGIGMGMSMEMQEDAAVDTLARLQRNVTVALPRAVLQSVINGQTASDATLDDAPGTSNLISADGYSDLNGSNGLRLRCIMGVGTSGTPSGPFTTSIGGNLTAANILAAREVMGDYGAYEADLALITSGKGYLGLLQDSNVLTVDKMGSQATIQRGMLASVGGVGVYFTSEFPSDMAATGIDAGTGATTGAVLVNRRRWILGTKRNAEVILLPQPGYDAMNVIGRIRTHFVSAGPIGASAEHATHYLINVT